jgi:SAM-dependent methyltransferase
MPTLSGTPLRWPPRRVTLRALAALVLAAHIPAAAQPHPEAEPREGRPGKDVLWLATPPALAEKMLDMAAVTAADRVLDLGAGDGRLVIAAARRGARATGLEYDPDLVALARRRAAEAGLAERATFVQADIFAIELPPAEVITLFLRGDLNLRLRPRLLALPAGTRIVSNTFDMGDWRPDQTARILDCDTWCFAHAWTVPAPVDGDWLLPEGRLTFWQTFQELGGTLRRGELTLTVTGRLRGERIEFRAGRVDYAGRVDGDVMRGTRAAGEPWTATRAPH